MKRHTAIMVLVVFLVLLLVVSCQKATPLPENNSFPLRPVVKGLAAQPTVVSALTPTPGAPAPAGYVQVAPGPLPTATPVPDERLVTVRFQEPTLGQRLLRGNALVWLVGTLVIGSLVALAVIRALRPYRLEGRRTTGLEFLENLFGIQLEQERRRR